nr:MAG TPA: hypothetical protein [Caudoviricetes sp.]
MRSWKSEWRSWKICKNLRYKFRKNVFLGVDNTTKML